MDRAIACASSPTPRGLRLYYSVVANPALWFVQHGLWARKHDPARDLLPAWRGATSSSIGTSQRPSWRSWSGKPDAAVLFHDYHLYVAPRLVRERRPDVPLSHFTHIPWVGADGWTVLPREIVVAIHEGLLSCDVVGFHTQRWRDAFLESCASLGLDPTRTLVRRRTRSRSTRPSSRPWPGARPCSIVSATFSLRARRR